MKMTDVPSVVEERVADPSRRATPSPGARSRTTGRTDVSARLAPRAHIWKCRGDSDGLCEGGAVAPDRDARRSGRHAGRLDEMEVAWVSEH